MLVKLDSINRLNFLVLLIFPVLLILGKDFVNIGVIYFTLSCIILIYCKKVNLFSKTENILFGVFFSYILLNSLFNYNNFENVLKSFALFRFIFFSTALVYVLKNLSLNNKIILKYVYTFVIFFVFIDIIYQYSFGIDLFGYGPGMCENGSCLRYQGVFGKELIAGSFFAYFALVVTLFLFQKNILDLLFLILGVAIIITGDRSPFIAYIIFWFSYILISNSDYKKKLLLLLSSLIIFFLIVSFFSSSQKRYIGFLQDIKYSGNENSSSFKDINNFFNDLKDSPWGKHYQVAWAMFLDKPLTGHGYNSFQIKCKKYEELTNTNSGKFKGCSNHPHNAFLEILAEQGLIGFLILNAIIFYIFNKILKLKFKNQEIKIKFILSGVLFLCFYFPLKPTGSLFSVWLGSVTFFVYSFYLFFLDRNKSTNS
jgi:O-antigen ligase